MGSMSNRVENRLALLEFPVCRKSMKELYKIKCDKGFERNKVKKK